MIWYTWICFWSLEQNLQMVVWWSFTMVESEKSPETNPNVIVRCPTSPNKTISLPFLLDFSMNMNTNCWLTHSCKIQVSKGPCNKPKKYYTPKNERMSPKNGTILKGPPLFGGTCVFFSGEVKRRPLPITFPKFRMDREHDGIQAILRWTFVNPCDGAKPHGKYLSQTGSHVTGSAGAKVCIP